MGIWEYQDYFNPQVDKVFQLSSNEGNTITRSSHVLATMLGISVINLKREDMNPSGSHKDRSLSYQISAHMQDGARDFVVSSTGNTAISAIMYCRYLNVELNIFLSPNIIDSKLHRLEHMLESTIDISSVVGESLKVDNFTFHFTNKPVSDSIKFAAQSKAILLRSSTDPYGVEGYKTIAFELIKQVPDAKEIYIPISSGTTAVGIYQGYKQLNEKMGLKIDIPEIHIVQSSAVNIIARDYDRDFIQTETSIIDSITDRVGHRKKQVDEAIKATGGTGWVVSDEQIQKAESLLKFANITTSLEGSMSIAAIKKSIANNRYPQKPVCIITGIKE